MNIPHYTIVSLITGNYEKVHEVKKKSPSADYVLVTDNPELKSNTWDIVYDTELSGGTFDRVHNIKWNPWRYCGDDIVLMIDGSMQVNESLDEIIEMFDRGNYELSMTIHPYRNTIQEELKAWITQRNYDLDSARRQIEMMENTGYDTLNYRGLYQGCFKLMRRTRKVEDWLRLMPGLLKATGRDGNDNRVEQTLASFALNKWFSDINAMWVSQNILHSRWITWYHHNTNIPILLERMIEPYAFNKPIKVLI